MIDLHCHALPGVDDGPPTLEDAVALLRAQAAVGVRTVAATSHVSREMPNRAEGLAEARGLLADVAAASGVGVELVAGAELDLDAALELPDDRLRAHALAGGSWLLVEAPLRPHPGVDLGVRELLVRGHRVLLAHPERSPAFQRQPKLLEELVAAGARAQVTAGALGGSFGGAVQEHALAVVRAGLCHVVASDAHGAERRTPGLVERLERVGLEEGAEQWCAAVPAAVLAGAEVDPRGWTPPRRRRRWGRAA